MSQPDPNEGLTAQQQARRARVRADWEPPVGPQPAGPGSDPRLHPGPGESLDHLSGEWRIFQREQGHRYSTDDLLTAWYGCHLVASLDVCPASALDLGSGIGSVAMMVAWRFPAVRLVAIEAQAGSSELFARSLRYNGATDRVELRRGDLRESSLLHPGETFDLVTGSPPYLGEGQGGISPDTQRDHCRFERRGGVEAYLKTGALALAPGGVFVLVHLWEDRRRIWGASKGWGLRPWRSLPVRFRSDKEPLIALYAFRQSGPGTVHRVEPPLIIRDEAGDRSEEWKNARSMMGFPP